MMVETIPTSRSPHGPGQPGKAGKEAGVAGLCPKRVLGGAGDVHHHPVAVGEDAVAEPVPAPAQEELGGLDRVQLETSISLCRPSLNRPERASSAWAARRSRGPRWVKAAGRVGQEPL